VVKECVKVGEEHAVGQFVFGAGWGTIDACERDWVVGDRQ